MTPRRVVLTAVGAAACWRLLGWYCGIRRFLKPTGGSGTISAAGVWGKTVMHPHHDCFQLSVGNPPRLPCSKACLSSYPSDTAPRQSAKSDTSITGWACVVPVLRQLRRHRTGAGGPVPEDTDFFHQ